MKVDQTCTRELVSISNQYMKPTCDNINGISSVTNQQSALLKTLAYTSIDIEARHRRNNLLFRGIKETRYENCSILVMEFLAHTLQINTTGTVITRVHRLGPTKVGQTFSRPIIVNYTNYNNVPLIMSNAKTGYSIDRDMSKVIVDARKRLWGKVKVTKKENPGSSVRKTELPRTNSRTGMLLWTSPG